MLNDEDSDRNAPNSQNEFDKRDAYHASNNQAIAAAKKNLEIEIDENADYDL